MVVGNARSVNFNWIFVIIIINKKKLVYSATSQFYERYVIHSLSIFEGENILLMLILVDAVTTFC